jgi:hypothetical protein
MDEYTDRRRCGNATTKEMKMYKQIVIGTAVNGKGHQIGKWHGMVTAICTMRDGSRMYYVYNISMKRAMWCADVKVYE